MEIINFLIVREIAILKGFLVSYIILRKFLPIVELIEIWNDSFLNYRYTKLLLCMNVSMKYR